MKVDKVIFSSDDSEYLDFWKLNSEITFKKLGITPVLFHITDEETDFYEDNFGIIKKIRKLPNYPTGIQAQIVRMYGTKYFQEEVCLTNDIDMFLFNHSFLENNLKDIKDDEMAILNSDAYDPKRPECTGIFRGPDRYPICYIAAKGKTFNKLLDTDVSFSDYVDKVESVGIRGHNDEIFFGKAVNSNENIKIHKIERGYCTNFYAPGRIEKDSFNKDSKSEFFKLNVNGYINISNFIDCHCKGPYIENRESIDKIRELILK